MTDYQGMLFRIEDVNGINPILRAYDQSEYAFISVEKSGFDKAIATMIREEINGSKKRTLHSYSKSIATCILKYNKFTDNELHILIDNCAYYNTVSYIGCQGVWKTKSYDIEYRYYDDMPFFNKLGIIQLSSFIVDVSDNDLLDKYLIKNTGVGRKKVASPEKDSEVVVFNPPSDLVIKNHMDGFYIIYALQMKYHFLSNRYIVEALISEIWQMDNEVFLDYKAEKIAFSSIIYYLHYNWGYEEQISQGVYKSSEESVHLSVFYDPILQHYGIQNDTFEETCDLISFYNMDPIANLALKYCWRYISNQRHIL